MLYFFVVKSYVAINFFDRYDLQNLLQSLCKVKWAPECQYNEVFPINQAMCFQG